jgi:copper transport protein
VQPSQVVFAFDRPVESPFDLIRVYGVDGRVDDGRRVRAARRSQLGVGLTAGLAAGSYLATYRVASEDGHVLSGSIVFSVRRRGDVLSLARLSQSLGARGSTNAVSVAARSLGDLAIAIATGVPLFVVLIWLPATRGAAKTRAQLRERFNLASLVLLAVGAGLGVAGNTVGVAAQAAAEANVSFWSALDPGRIPAVLSTRAGAVWGIRAALFAVLTLVAIALARPARAKLMTDRNRDVQSTGPPRVERSRQGFVLAAAALPPLAFLAVSPALAGHPSSQRPTAVLIPLDLIHVSAMSLWLGGLLALIMLVPYAVHVLAQDQRAAPLAAVVLRFSSFALAAVLALGLTGALQSFLLIRSWHALLDTSYGTAVVAKSCLLMALMALGAVSRQRALPALRSAVAAAGGAGGRHGTRILARVGRLEIALLAGVLITAGLLVGYAPPVTPSFSPISRPLAWGTPACNLRSRPRAPASTGWTSTSWAEVIIRMRACTSWTWRSACPQEASGRCP